MEKNLKLSKKYGLNPTIPICFWCGKETGEIALMGEVNDIEGREIEMPMHAVINYEPCAECASNMKLGVTIIEVTEKPNETTNMPIQHGCYPTGRWVVIKFEAANRVFGTDSDKIFVDNAIFNNIIGNGGDSNV